MDLKDPWQSHDSVLKGTRQDRSVLARFVLRTPIWRAACWSLGVAAVCLYGVAALNGALVSQVASGFAIGFTFAALIGREQSDNDLDK